MKKLLYLLIIFSLASCGILRKKDKTTSTKEEVLTEKQQGQEIKSDSSVVTNHTKITFNGTNPFKTPEAGKFANDLFNLSVLNMPAKQLDSTVNVLKSKYNDLTNAGAALGTGGTKESWTNEKKGSTSNSMHSGEKEVKKKEAENHVVNHSILESIPWYVWVLVIIGALVFLAFYIDKKLRF